MFESDYIMRMILQFLRFLRRVLEQRDRDPREAALDLERQIGEAVNIDPELFFALTPDSMLTMLDLGGFNQQLAEYMVRAMALDISYLDEAELTQRAELRRLQLNGLIEAFDLDLKPDDLTYEAIEAFANNQGDDEEFEPDTTSSV